MQLPVTTKRKSFTRAQKLKILNELTLGGINHSELARKHGISPITIYAWKRQMAQSPPKNQPEYSELLEENDRLKEKINNLKKALGELAVDKQILQTANDVLKKMEREEKLRLQKKSSKK